MILFLIKQLCSHFNPSHWPRPTHLGLVGSSSADQAHDHRELRETMTALFAMYAILQCQ